MRLRRLLAAASPLPARCSFLIVSEAVALLLSWMLERWWRWLCNVCCNIITDSRAAHNLNCENGEQTIRWRRRSMRNEARRDQVNWLIFFTPCRCCRCWFFQLIFCLLPIAVLEAIYHLEWISLNELVFVAVLGNVEKLSKTKSSNGPTVAQSDRI